MFRKKSLFVNKINVLHRQSFALCSKFAHAKRIEIPWINSGIVQSIKIKSKYFKLNKLGLVDDETNKSFENLLTKLIRKSKKDYYRTCSEKLQATLSRRDDDCHVIITMVEFYV